MSNAVTYLSPGRLEALRATGLGLTIVGAAGLVLLGGQLFVWEEPGPALGALAVFVAGLAMLLTSRARLARLWAHNKAYLLAEQGASVLHGRREFARRLVVVARILLSLFIVCAIAFFFLFSAIACGDRVDGFCGDVGTPPESAVVAMQALSIGVGAAWAAVVYARRRYDDETDRIDRVVAEGQRRRRNDHPMAGTDRFSWE